jgi:ArsR family metal-binding transcriptional regulator
MNIKQFNYNIRKPRISIVRDTVNIVANLPNGDTLLIKIEDVDDAYRIGREIIDAALESASRIQEESKSSSSSTHKSSQSPQD